MTPRAGKKRYPRIRKDTARAFLHLLVITVLFQKSSQEEGVFLFSLVCLAFPFFYISAFLPVLLKNILAEFLEYFHSYE